MNWQKFLYKNCTIDLKKNNLYEESSWFLSLYKKSRGCYISEGVLNFVLWDLAACVPNKEFSYIVESGIYFLMQSDLYLLLKKCASEYGRTVAKFLAIFSLYASSSVTKLRFRRSFWNAWQVKILMSSIVISILGFSRFYNKNFYVSSLLYQLKFRLVNHLKMTTWVSVLYKMTILLAKK